MTAGNRSADLAVIGPQYSSGYFSLNGTASLVSGYVDANYTGQSVITLPGGVTNAYRKQLEIA